MTEHNCFSSFLKVYDSFGKMGSSVKDGNVNQPGSLQQCRSAIGPGFSAQYCQVFLKQVNSLTYFYGQHMLRLRENKMFFRLFLQGAIQYFVGICLPDSCREQDVERVVQCGEGL